MKTKSGFIVLFLIMAIICQQTVVFAEFGPVKVVPGGQPMQTTQRACRANQPTAFSINFRHTETINFHDWIKVWFPANETLCSIEDACDGIPGISGTLENARFIPCKDYFEKYKDSKESDLGKLYRITNNETADTEFFDCENNQEQKSDCRMIEDPSGLGYWMGGTVMPALPKNDAKRVEKLGNLDHKIRLAGIDCDCSPVYPVIVNTPEERSLKITSILQIWKGDGPYRGNNDYINLFIQKDAGIISPMSPGKYSLMVATKPEPIPIESEMFVIPCSSISKPAVSFETSDIESASQIKINFSTGEGGALDKGISKIWLEFPEGFSLPKEILPQDMKINGKLCPKNTSLIATDTKTISVISPIDINNSSEIEIVFSKLAGIRTPGKKGTYTINAWTDPEPEKIESEPFLIQTKTRVEVEPNLYMHNAKYLAVFNMDDDQQIHLDQEIMIAFPEGTILPATAKQGTVLINEIGYAQSISIENKKVIIKAPFGISKMLKIEFLKEFGIKNPPEGEHELFFTTSGKTNSYGKFTIISKPLVSDLILSDYKAKEVSGFSFKYFPSATGNLSPGDIMTLIFPEEYAIPEKIAPESIKIKGYPSRNILTQKNEVTLTLDCKVSLEDNGALVEISSGAGVTNPERRGAYRVIVKTSKDENTESNEYSIKEAKLLTQLVFEDPSEPDGLEYDGWKWFKKPPKVKIFSWNPDATVYFWFDNNEAYKTSLDEYPNIDFGEYVQLQSTFSYCSELDGEKEEIKSVKLWIDNVLPKIWVQNPEKNILITNKKTITIAGNRTPGELRVYGDWKYTLDGVSINGETILQPEIVEKDLLNSTKMEFEKQILLAEGDNKIKIRGFDVAGNEKIITKIVTLDTTSPEIEIVTPNPKKPQKIGESIVIQIKTETGALVYINGQLAEKTKELPWGIAVFEGNWNVVKGENKVEINSTDMAGNANTIFLTFEGSYYESIVELWIGRTEFYINGEKMPNPSSAPTCSSPPLPKDFKGTAFLPIQYLLTNALYTSASYDGDTNKITITQSSENEIITVIELGIGEKQAKVNGVEVWIDKNKILYPIIISGSVFFPLRFMAENLNCDVKYDPKTKKITLAYPKQ